MVKSFENKPLNNLSYFNRHFFKGKERFTCIGKGSIGGKAHGLAMMKNFLEEKTISLDTTGIVVNIPTLTVITTEFFDLFMKQNDLYEVAYSSMSDDLIAHAFQRGELPAQFVGDLRALISQVHTPLAIRSSSMLEDAMFEPFASVYATKMIPNNQYDPDTRFNKLIEAIKYIYASTFFKNAKNYIKMTKHITADEKMAVIIQEVVGTCINDRFYPNISGVARSYNFYPIGHAKPEEAVVDLALGLGKTIVDDGIAWSYSPAYPMSNPPHRSINDLLKQSQTEFWAINMGKPPAFDPIKETEYMRKYNLSDAEYDGNLQFIASTFNPQDNRVTMGVSVKGPRVLDFSPILKFNVIPLNNLIRTLLKICEDILDNMVEIEFAVTLDRDHGTPARLGFLQVRPMVVSQANLEVLPSELVDKNVLLASEQVLGNGIIDCIRDVVYIKAENFSSSKTLAIAAELEKINNKLVVSKRPYLLIGFGRWGTTDQTGGIPVNFGQISGAKVIVEATLPGMDFSLSQGSHFFHNVTSFQICYFSIYYWGKYNIDWNWLKHQKVISESKFVCHVELSSPLLVKVDGRNRRGVISHG